MLKQKIKYTDYDGNEREEEFQFNLTKAEVIELELTTKYGLTKTIEMMVAKEDMPQLIELFKRIILMAYGEKSLDGKRFVKSSQLSLEFSQTEAYAILFMDLMTHADKAAAFIQGIIPADIKPSAG